MEVKNAKITDVKLYIEDHDILTFHIFIDTGCGCCAIGGYALDRSFKVYKSKDEWEYVKKASPAGFECMRRIMEVVGVRSWEDLKGKYIRYEDKGWGATVDTIGNILKDDWINIREFFKNYDYIDWYSKFVSVGGKNEKDN